MESRGPLSEMDIKGLLHKMESWGLQDGEQGPVSEMDSKGPLYKCTGDCKMESSGLQDGEHGTVRWRAGDCN
jgi:hypothetical protein